jgi:pimeloyl-ACP methyl ester carboxylesterase
LLTQWKDPSPHTVHFVKVDNNVKVEVLDWGGKGRPLILLAGGGNTAHVFDDFATKLTANFQVYGITRRGFGDSGFSEPLKENQIDDDILLVMDSFKLDKPILVAHSIGGAELSAVASSHPNRIAGLVYLEAGYPYAFNNGKGPTMTEFMDLRPPQRPSSGNDHLVSFEALQKSENQTYGNRTPEAEFRHTWEFTPDGKSLKRKDSPGWSTLMTMLNSNTKYTDIKVPALVLFAIPHTRDNWMTESSNPDLHKEAESYFAKIDSLTRKQATVFKEAIPTARIVELGGSHFIFMSNEKDVLREIRTFTKKLK